MSFSRVVTPSMAMEITPEMAKDILESRNTSNRRLRMWWAHALAAAIRRGEWIITHQGIAFDCDGNLIDGQHRLWAIINSGIPVKMFVFEGLDARAFMTIDIGIKRNVSDTTGLEKRAAEVCNRLAGIAGKQGATSSSPQQARVVADAGVEEIHARLIEYCGSVKKVYTSSAIRAAAVLLVMDGYQESKVFKTYADVVHRNFEEIPAVGHAFMRQVDDGKASATKGGYDLLARALKFLNPNNSELKKIQISDAEAQAAATYAREIVRRAIANDSGLRYQ